MKKFYVITPKAYTDDSLKISSVVQLDTKDVDKVKEKYDVEEVDIKTKKSKKNDDE